MKNATMVSLCLGSLLAFAATAAIADNAKSQPGQMYKALGDLKAKGYVIVKKIEFDNNNGEFKADVVNAEGKTINLYVNPKTGNMSKEQGAITGWTAMEVAKKVQDAGYNNIYEINTEIFGNEYAVKALDDKDQKVSLKVDVRTGNITKITD